jgi:hypothetical protein
MKKILIIILVVICIFITYCSKSNIQEKILEINFIYSKHSDLVFHVLAYLEVNNASNLYDIEYINKMELEKQDFGYNIIPNINLLQEYYNVNFGRLGIINFLPFYCNNFIEYKNMLLNFNQFNQNDIQYFINPFIEIMEKESLFYFYFWDKLHNNNINIRESLEEYIKNNLNKFNHLFEYFNKSSNVFLSYSITRNGRGFYIDDYFSAVVPFIKDQNKFQNVFFMLLHEYTHQFTDNLLNSNINFNDGSHNLSEKVVILADYYLIKGIDENLIKNYIGFFSGDAIESENDFINYFMVEETLKIKIIELIKSVIKK